MEDEIAHMLAQCLISKLLALALTAQRKIRARQKNKERESETLSEKNSLLSKK